jgi:hypothetical protein
LIFFTGRVEAGETKAGNMVRKAIIIGGVTLFTCAMLVAATLRMNGGFENFADISAKSVNSSVAEYAGLAHEAYIYAQPLLNSYRDLYRDIADESTPDYIGAFNTLKVTARVEGEANQLIGLKAWLDLRAEPMLLHVPRDGGRLEAVGVTDLYGREVFRMASLGSDANYLVVPWNWEGEVPLGIRKVIRSSSDLVRVHSVTRLASAATFEHLKAWANTVALLPLSAYIVQPPPERSPRVRLPRWQESHAGTAEFIPYLNFTLLFLHPEGAEAEQLTRYQRIGIVAGLPWAPDRYRGAISAGINRARKELADLEKDVEEGVATIGPI